MSVRHTHTPHTHTHTHTHRHRHTQTDTHAESRGETHVAPNNTVCVGGEESSPQCQSAVTTDMTDRTVKGWEILPHPPRP